MNISLLTRVLLHPIMLFSYKLERAACDRLAKKSPAKSCSRDARPANRILDMGVFIHSPCPRASLMAFMSVPADTPSVALTLPISIA